MPLPRLAIPRLPRVEGGFPDPGAWERAASLELRRAQDGGAALDPTRVRVLDDGRRLFVRFDCVDTDVWATHTERDAPLWEEEVVEIFLAGGGSVPVRYFELEVNPLGTLFDAVVDNPDGRRATMRVDTTWNAPGLIARIARDVPGAWSAEIALPWAACFEAPPPSILRANFFRVERPRGRPAEFTCWSPTLADPPDFHRPEYFGILVREPADGEPEDS
ncbi:MAG TPA: carbohydrate-binding family 9-like protein [Candidatus Polarisedimenticolaceae bacterium]|nr:carbohydrate-binding family 9-like protein [Candidatus Polarisedimenticolaceae bacterium]